MRLNAQQLRTLPPDRDLIKNIKKNPIYLVLDNVLDTYNIGSIFRLADAFAVKKIYLCGNTETPPNPRIKKASISTWKWITWSYKSTTLQAIEEIKTQNKGIKIIAIEQHAKSLPLSKFIPTFPLVLVVGNETYGISDEVLNVVDDIVEIPMYGVNKSLNVMVCLGIVLYQVVERLQNTSFRLWGIEKMSPNAKVFTKDRIKNQIEQYE